MRCNDSLRAALYYFNLKCVTIDTNLKCASFFFMGEPVPAWMFLAVCDLIRVLKQHCILRNFFIRDVRGSRKELSAFLGRILCKGGIIQDDMVRIGFIQISNLVGHNAVNDGQLAVKEAFFASHS